METPSPSYPALPPQQHYACGITQVKGRVRGSVFGAAARPEEFAVHDRGDDLSNLEIGQERRRLFERAKPGRGDFVLPRRRLGVADAAPRVQRAGGEKTGNRGAQLADDALRRRLAFRFVRRGEDRVPLRADAVGDPHFHHADPLGGPRARSSSSSRWYSSSSLLIRSIRRRSSGVGSSSSSSRKLIIEAKRCWAPAIYALRISLSCIAGASSGIATRRSETQPDSMILPSSASRFISCCKNARSAIGWSPLPAC